MADLAESVPLPRRRSCAARGDIIEASAGNVGLVYLQYSSDWGRAAAVRVLPGRWARRLQAGELAELAAGPEERVALCALAVFLKGPGVEVVAKAPVPRHSLLPPPVVLRWEPDKPGGGLVEGRNHKTYTVSEFQKLHPRINVAKLPGFAVPMSPLRAQPDRDREPPAVDPHPARLLRRAADPELSAPQLALLELHKDRAEPTLLMWYALARDAGAPAFATVRQLIRQASRSTMASVAICAAEPARWPPSEQQPGGLPSDRVKAHQERHVYPAEFRSHLLGLLAERELGLSADDLDLLYSLVGANPWRVVLRFVAAASGRYFRDHPGDPRVVASLDALLVRLQEGCCRATFWANLQAVRSAQVQPGELDLAIIGTADNFAAPARALAQELAASWASTGQALGHLASARGTAPSPRWAQGCRTFAVDAEFSQLLRELLTLVVDTDAIEAWPGLRRRLLCESNIQLVRGALWAVPFAEGDWRAPLLGQLALRCGNATWSNTVSLAALDALQTINDAVSLRELEDLFEEVDDPTLLKRVGAALGAPGDLVANGVERLRAAARDAADHPWNGRWC